MLLRGVEDLLRILQLCHAGEIDEKLRRLSNLRHIIRRGNRSARRECQPRRKRHTRLQKLAASDRLWHATGAPDRSFTHVGFSCGRGQEVAFYSTR